MYLMGANNGEQHSNSVGKILSSRKLWGGRNANFSNCIDVSPGLPAQASFILWTAVVFILIPNLAWEA